MACDLSNWLSQKNEPCSEGFKTHLWCFQGHRQENINFSTKPRLKDAYLHTPILKHHHCFLLFGWQHQHYQYKVLPVWLAMAPVVFTSLTKHILYLCHYKDFCVTFYLDDNLVLTQSNVLEIVLKPCVLSWLISWFSGSAFASIKCPSISLWPTYCSFDHSEFFHSILPP